MPSADGNPSRKTRLNVQESAEAVVRKYGTPENGRAERQLKDETATFESDTKKAEFRKELNRKGKGEARRSPKRA
jgi:hypothetical protein